MPGIISRQQRFDVVVSTNDIVRGWLEDGTPEVCLAFADEQTAGRGRDGRTWVAPAGSSLLLSLGFRPRWLRPEHAWRLAAVVSLAMADAAETVSGSGAGTIRLKWPNDLVVIDGDGDGEGVRKLAGVLGESDGLGTDDPRLVIGIGVNTDWAPDDFPAGLAGTMTSLRALTGRSIDHEAVLESFLPTLERSVVELMEGRFDGPGWAARQVTTDRDIDLISPDGARTTVRATGVDADSGALLVGDRSVMVGEIAHVRLATTMATLPTTMATRV